ncbi:hypothetical protein [Tabrizicola sp.]|uniref:hypothetical protein n=1 Tax=Tabrizicola sp. TaxID=2005166 RepID=UPI00273660CE|nr:hypothetical protein [Tabrizicola sp.]MDP3198147.1 hypothetical protein [Tabrizicola sp.]
MRLAPALVFLAAPAWAEPPRLSLVFGVDRLDAQAADIPATRRIDEERGSALYIRLSPGFDAAMRVLTTTHVGDTGDLRICAETVLAPVIQAPIDEAVFVITDTDPARIDRLQALLSGPTCAEVPGG